MPAAVEQKIHLTETAAKQLKRLAAKEGLEDFGLRMAVKGGGCSGLTYKLALAKEPEETDKISEDNGVKLFVDFKSMFYLGGMTLDFAGGLNGKGFEFGNPNAKSTCGCGNSFAV